MSNYATIADLATYGCPAGALAGVSVQDQQAQLDAASTVADGFLRNKFTLPIVTASADLTMYVAKIAAWNLLVRRGFNPDDPTAQAVRDGHQDAMDWLKRVAAGTVTPMLVDSSGSEPGGAGGGPFVVQPRSSGDVDSQGFPVMTVGAPRSRGWV